MSGYGEAGIRATVGAQLEVREGQIDYPDAGPGIEVVAAAQQPLRVLGFRLQVYGATSASDTYVEGADGTVVSGRIYSDSNGLDYVQDNVNVLLEPSEALQIRSDTDGTIAWALFLEYPVTPL